jgi:hypothetical protein
MLLGEIAQIDHNMFMFQFHIEMIQCLMLQEHFLNFLLFKDICIFFSFSNAFDLGVKKKIYCTLQIASSLLLLDQIH